MTYKIKISSDSIKFFYEIKFTMTNNIFLVNFSFKGKFNLKKSSK